jgi:multimeric flavodoxin WrbA
MSGHIITGKDKPYIIAAIYGSPRRKGNTALLLDSFLEGVRYGCSATGKYPDIKKIIASELDLSPCRECRVCSRTGECIIGDDMQDIYRILTDADFIAVASPVFFTTVSGYLKAIIDRCQRFWSLKYEHKKNIIKKKRGGIFICVSGSERESIFDCPKKVIRSFFDVLFVDYIRDFLYGKTDSEGEILKNNAAVEDVYNFGKKIGTGNTEKE